jgi:hypothetical protein
MALAALIMSAILFSKYNNGSLCGSCTNGTNGIDGINGTNGTNGNNGTDLTALDFADFYATMPGDNAATVAVGGDVDFPTTGTNNGGGIFALTVDSFQLSSIGKYDVSFFVSVSEAGQLELTLDGTPLALSVTGRATGTNYIATRLLIDVVSVNTTLTVRNPTGNAAALTITPIAGGASSVTAHLSIVRLT